MKPLMKTTLSAVKTVLLAIAVSATAIAVSADEAKNLDQLLKQVEQGRIAEARDNRKREQRFLNEKSNQQKQLRNANNLRTAKERESAALEKAFERNERLLTDRQNQLKEKMGNLTELFGHLTSTSGDLRSVVENSLVSIQYPNREVFLDELIDKMSGSEKLPSIEEIERLWFEMQREMTESGRIVAFDATVVKPDGEKVNQKVIRVGSYNVISESGQYLTFENGSLSELARQPSGPYLQWGKNLGGATDGLNAFGVDPTGPSGGSYLAALIDSPNLVDRWHQGGVIGYIISGVGLFALIVAFWRLLALSITGAKVRSQLKSNKISIKNPLGRILKIHEDNPAMDTETLELKLSEQVLREVPKLESGLNLLKIISAVAPLMGLLGTVTGMIITFQAITIFGAGDPKAMAGGISGALVTTVLGLVVAIPVVLLHTLVNSRSKKIVNIIVEQSTGIIAQHTESQMGKQNKNTPAAVKKSSVSVQAPAIA